ncbi:hypothetical protein ACSNM0_27570, partial [Klebsiella pneumoniae]
RGNKIPFRRRIDSSKPTCRQNRCCKNGSDHRFRFPSGPLTGDEHPAAIRQLLGAMADNMDEAKSRIEDMMRELAHRHDLNDQPHKMQQVSH